jgi:hypothetical protein
MNTIKAYLWANKGYKDRVIGKSCIGIRFSKSDLSFFKNKKIINIILFHKKFSIDIENRFFNYPILCNRDMKSIFINHKLHMWEPRKNPKLIFEVLDDITLKLIKIL